MASIHHSTFPHQNLAVVKIPADLISARYSWSQSIWFCHVVINQQHSLSNVESDLHVFQIDSVQSLLQCPSILVCVGREPFHPLLLDSFRKNSYDKLPRLNVKSRSSVCSDEKGAKKNGRSLCKKSFSLSLIIHFFYDFTVKSI